jgi:hypothetical protein
MIIGPHVNNYIFRAQYSSHTTLQFLGLKNVACKLKFLLTINEMKSQIERGHDFLQCVGFFPILIHEHSIQF